MIEISSILIDFVQFAQSTFEYNQKMPSNDEGKNTFTATAEKNQNSVIRYVRYQNKPEIQNSVCRKRWTGQQLQNTMSCLMQNWELRGI